MKNIIKKIPVIGEVAQRVYHKIKPSKPFLDSENYWKERYETGGDSGGGSYRKLAEFKAEILNKFVQRENIKTVIEYGCGDGNQLKLLQYPMYTGFDVSPTAIALCNEIFTEDTSKAFKLMTDYTNETAQLTLSLDVIYHLVEDDVYNEYMQRLFNSSEGFVIIYSSNLIDDHQELSKVPHVKHREFSQWVDKMKPEWKLIEHIPNRYPYRGNSKIGSVSDFFIYKKT